MQEFPESMSIKRRYTKLFRKKLDVIAAAQAAQEERKWKEYAKKPQQFLWKTVKEAIGEQGTNYPPLKNGTIVTKEDKAQVFLDSYKKVSQRTKESETFDEHNKKYVEEYLLESKSDFDVDVPQVDYNAPLRLEELEFAMGKLKKSAVGPDGIPNWAYKNSPTSRRSAMLMLFNLSLSTGEFPQSYRFSDIVSLPKAGKDHTLPKNYRPISLTNTISRIFESIIHKRLYAYCEIHKVLPPTQFAYRHNRSSVDPLILLTQDIKAGLRRFFVTNMIQLDITKAFDTVWLDGLSFKLHKIGVKNHLLAWLSSYVSNRKYRVITPATTEFEEFEDGVPQGSSLSPLLFTIFLSDIVSKLKCKHAEFADDFTLWKTVNSELIASSEMQQDLDLIEQWSAKWRISFGDKCSQTLFHPLRKRKLPDFKLRFNNKPLKKDQSPKLLGLNLDPQLTYKRHIEILERKLKQKIGILYKIIASKLGSVRSALISIYKGWIRPTAEIASILFASGHKTFLHKLDLQQAKALRAILGSSNNTPHIILATECSVSSLSSRRELDVLKKLRKIQAMPPDALLRKSFQEWNKSDSHVEHLNRPTTGFSFFGYAVKLYHSLFNKSALEEFVPVTHLIHPRPWDQRMHNRTDPHKEFRKEIRKKVRLKQQEEYDSISSVEHYRKLRPTCLPMWPHQTLPSRQLTIILFKLRSGYCKVGTAKHFLPLDPCPGCAKTDSIEHFLLECPAYSRLRSEMTSQVPKLGQQALSLEQLLGHPKDLSNSELRQVAHAAAKFVVRARRKI